MISNHMPSKMWDEITYPFLNFASATVEAASPHRVNVWSLWCAGRLLYLKLNMWGKTLLCPELYSPGQFWHSGIVIVSVCLCVCPSIFSFEHTCVHQPWACLHDNLWYIQAKITKFGPEVQITLFKITFVLGSDWSSCWGQIEYKREKSHLCQVSFMSSFTTRVNTLATRENS